MAGGCAVFHPTTAQKDLIALILSYVIFAGICAFLLFAPGCSRKLRENHTVNREESERGHI